MVGRIVFGNAFDDSAKLICDRVRGGSPSAAAANARLIGAAPELLDALKTARRVLAVVGRLHETSMTREALEVIDAALAKAEGGA